MESRGLRDLHDRGFYSVDDAFDYGIRVVYWGCFLPDSPVSDGTIRQLERNSLIRNAHAAGVAVSDIVKQFQISSQRVYQILRNN